MLIADVEQLADFGAVVVCVASARILSEVVRKPLMISSAGGRGSIRLLPGFSSR
jgi:hypothetical protein